MTEAAPHADRPEPSRDDVVETRTAAGYRFFQRKKQPEEQKAVQKLARRERSRRATERLLQLIDYVFSLLYALLVLRLGLGLIGANEQAGFVRFTTWATQPFYAPFVDIVQNPTVQHGRFELPLVFALWAYLLLHLAVRRLLRVLLGAPRAT